MNSEMLKEMQQIYEGYQAPIVVEVNNNVAIDINKPIDSNTKEPVIVGIYNNIQDTYSIYKYDTLIDIINYLNFYIEKKKIKNKRRKEK